MQDREIIATSLLGAIINASTRALDPSQPIGGMEQKVTGCSTSGEYNVWLALQYADLLLHVSRTPRAKFDEHDIWP